MSAVDPPSSAPAPDGETHSRRYPRLTCFIAVLVRAKDLNLVVMGNLSTIGLGGCGVELKTSVAMGANVEVAPLESEQLSVAGTVVNLRILSGKPGYGIGIEFQDADDRKVALVKFAERKTEVDEQHSWHNRRVGIPEEGKS